MENKSESKGVEKKRGGGREKKKTLELKEMRRHLKGSGNAVLLGFGTQFC